MDLYVRTGRRYRPAMPEQVLEVAAAYQLDHFPEGAVIRSPMDAKDLVASQLRGLESEHFGALWLNSRHRTIRWEVLFKGTVDGASVYPRVIAQTALQVNAAAVILAHNHPSGVAEPSEADRQITQRLVRALGLLDVRVLDHLVVSARDVISFAERGLLR